MAVYPPRAEDEALPYEDLSESIRRRQPELYGKLLEVHDELDNSGTLTFAGYLVLLLAAYSGLWSGWYQRLPGLADVNLNNFWTYSALFVAALFGFMAHTSWLEGRRYAKHRRQLQDMAGKAGLSRYELLARLESDAAVKKALERIKRDRWE